MHKLLNEINTKPEVFSRYTADSLWTDDYRSKQMLALHLNESVDVSSRNIDFINRSSQWIAEHFELGRGKSVCDFGCGPGLYTSRFAKSGARVTGLDFSENSLRYAREQAKQHRHTINYIHTNYLEFEPQEPFDLLAMIMCDFCALSPAQRKTLLKKFHACLKDEGALLMDVYSMAAYAQREEVAIYEKNQLNQFWFEGDYYCFLNTFKYDEAAVVLDKYSLFPENGAPETVYNWLQYFSPESLEQELSEAGFTIHKTYGDVASIPYTDQCSEFAIVARKKV